VFAIFVFAKCVVAGDARGAALATDYFIAKLRTFENAVADLAAGRIPR
jgi:hypothetical protein